MRKCNETRPKTNGKYINDDAMHRFVLNRFFFSLFPACIRVYADVWVCSYYNISSHVCIRLMQHKTNKTNLHTYIILRIRANLNCVYPSTSFQTVEFRISQVEFYSQAFPTFTIYKPKKPTLDRKITYLLTRPRLRAHVVNIEPKTVRFSPFVSTNA